MEINKYDLGLERCERIAKAKKKYEKLKEGLQEFNSGLRRLGYKKDVEKGPIKLIETIDEIFSCQEAVEFLDKETYCKYFRKLQEFDSVYDDTRECCHVIGSDFCSLSLCEFVWLGIELLDIGTYDSLIFSEFPCTEEVFCSGYFGYYENENANETRVTGPEECWEFLKKEYEELD